MDGEVQLEIEYRAIGDLIPYVRNARTHRATQMVAWRTDDNTQRPHSCLGWKTPKEFAQTFTPQRGPTLRNPQSAAPKPIAQSAQMGKAHSVYCSHKIKVGGNVKL